MGRDASTEEKGCITPRDRNITFERGTDFVVPYVGENISRCKCPQCPVQADSRAHRIKLKFQEKQ
jgi:hypothetical protein